MTHSKVIAWILLVFVIGAVIFSVVSMYLGRLEQAMLFTPLLFVIYIFGLGVHKKIDNSSGQEEPERGDKEQKASSDREK